MRSSYTAQSHSSFVRWNSERENRCIHLLSSGTFFGTEFFLKAAMPTIYFAAGQRKAVAVGGAAS